MASFQDWSTIEHFLFDNTGQGVFVNMIASMIHFAISNVALWHWATFESPIALHCGTSRFRLDWGSGSTWVGTWSDLHNLLRRVEFRCIINCCAIVPAACHEFVTGWCEMTVLPCLKFFATEHHIVYKFFSQWIWP